MFTRNLNLEGSGFKLNRLVNDSNEECPFMVHGRSQSGGDFLFSSSEPNRLLATVDSLGGKSILTRELQKNFPSWRELK